MQITKTFRRAVATVILTAGLAYPACAAVCPKGIGGCPSPGRCFLFTDADTNSLCDYTSRSGSQASGALPSRPGTPASAQTAVQTTTTPVPDPVTTHISATTAPAQGQNTSAGLLQSQTSGGFPGSLHLSPVMTEVILFLILAGIFFALFRTGMLGLPVRKTRPALALSALFGLGTSLILTCVLTGSTASGTTYALVYLSTGTLLAAYLWHTGVMTGKIGMGAAALGTLAGFVFLAPIMPQELGGIVNVVTGVSTLTAGVLVICAVILLALVLGRVFCGNICPVGSLQELAYHVPVKKIVIQHTGVVELIRLAVFVITVIAAVYLIDVMALTGLYDLFSLTLSAGLVVAAGLVLLSMFVYRPVCRLLCPFGVLFSLFAEFSWFRLQRTEDCIGCGKCERACPARTAGAEDPKRECYLCARCTDACPVATALVYHR
jgi:ferredoxin